MSGYTVKPGVVLKPEEKRFVAAVAADFAKPLVVTSGYRGPDKQATAMYVKFKVGGSYHIYRQAAAAKAVHDIYESGVKVGKDRATIIRSMAKVMTDQERKGIYISRHMQATAVDFRTFDLSIAERRQLEDICRKHGAKVLLAEGHPVHLHVQF